VAIFFPNGGVVKSLDKKRCIV